MDVSRETVKTGLAENLKGRRHSSVVLDDCQTALIARKPFKAIVADRIESCLSHDVSKQSSHNVRECNDTGYMLVCFNFTAKRWYPVMSAGPEPWIGSTISDVSRETVKADETVSSS